MSLNAKPTRFNWGKVSETSAFNKELPINRTESINSSIALENFENQPIGFAIPTKYELQKKDVELNGVMYVVSKENPFAEVTKLMVYKINSVLLNLLRAARTARSTQPLKSGVNTLPRWNIGHPKCGAHV